MAASKGNLYENTAGFYDLEERQDHREVCVFESIIIFQKINTYHLNFSTYKSLLCRLKNDLHFLTSHVA